MRIGGQRNAAKHAKLNPTAAVAKARARRVLGWGAVLMCCFTLFYGVWTQRTYAAEDAEGQAVVQSDGSSTHTVDVALPDSEEKVAVEVNAPEGTLPEGAELHAELLSDEADTKAVVDELDKADVTYDGFTALDVHFADADGNEVEPNGSVNVKIELPQAALGDDVDASTLAVQHLAEDENGDVAKVEAVADAADGTEGTVAAENDAVTADFSTDSFSTFTITFNKRNAITVHLVDEKGVELPGGTINFSDLSSVHDPTDFGSAGEGKFLNDKWVSVQSFVSTLASKTQGYTYVGAYSDSGLENQFYWIRFNSTNNSYGWRYGSGVNAPNSNSGNGKLNAIYLVYTPVSEVTQSGDVQIDDNVAQDGTFTASYSGTAADAASYVWEESIDGNNSWSTIERLKMNGDDYNMTDNGQALNVVLNVVNNADDQGGRWYRVTAYDGEGNALGTSQPMQLKYYDELRNGSFESPVVDDMTSGSDSNYQYPTGTDELIWKTTGDDQQIEIVNGDNAARGGNPYKNKDGAYDGEQYAELNAEAAGALYQDVMTVPGTTLNWQFSHRGRDGQDTMYMVIAPTSAVKDITTQEKLMDFITDVRQNPGNHPGCYVISKSDDNTEWGTYTSNQTGNEPYRVPEGQYLTRFFFVAGETASKSDTVGNLLDNVKFTTGLVDPEPGTANLTVQKYVTGVDNVDDLKNYEVTVNAKGTHVTQTGKLTGFTGQGDNTYLARYTFDPIIVDANSSLNLTVTENPATLDDYTLDGSTWRVDGSEDQSGTSTKVTVKEGSNSTVTFTNNYSKNSVTIPGLQETKKVDGHNAAVNDFTFTVQSVGETADKAAELAGWNGSDDYDSRTKTYTFHNDAIGQNDTSVVRRSHDDGTGLTFTREDIGTYTYIYRESTPVSGWQQVDATMTGADGTSASSKAWKLEITVSAAANDSNKVQAKVKVFASTDGGTNWESSAVFDKTYTEDAGASETIVLPFENKYVVTANLQILKYEDTTDPGDSSAPSGYQEGDALLDGATFELYKESDDTAESPSYDESSDTEVAGGGSQITKNGGLATFSNLAPGTYWLKETSVPAGYTMLDNPLKIVVTDEGVVHAMLPVKTPDGSVSYDTELTDDNKATQINGTSTYQVTIENTGIKPLPTTGSSGTIAVSAAGIAIAVLAGVYLFQKRKGLQN